ncbi:MAG: efflux transporter outer membrane subunit [Mariprofundus sp.]
MVIKRTLHALLLIQLTACATVGPDFVKPDVELPAVWSENRPEGSQNELHASMLQQSQWWKLFNDPILNQLVETAWQQNNSLEIAGLRVLEARAQLGIAQGLLFPQTQAATGAATHVSPAGTSPNFSQYSLGIGAAWEMDFWGRFERGIESADAAFMASIEGRNQVLLLLTAQVVDTYVVIRVNEELLRIAHENLALQQRSYGIAEVQYRNGSTSELDKQQAKTLLLGTKASIPGLEVAIRKARNALSVLLGKPPGAVDQLLQENRPIPSIPDQIEIGVPADLLRQRPDVRQAEMLAMAQNARVGLAEADLYPSFSLTGSIGLAAGGLAGGTFGDLFAGDALSYSVGPSFVWPFLNYGRIKNNVRVQDARLQQALIQYRETVIQAAREVEDSMASFVGTKEQATILAKAVTSAQRSNKLSMLRYKEGFSDYQRVLDSQKSLFNQQKNLTNARGGAVRNLVSLYKALGGSWDAPTELISEQSREDMEKRTDWGDLNVRER